MPGTVDTALPQGTTPQPKLLASGPTVCHRCEGEGLEGPLVCSSCSGAGRVEWSRHGAEKSLFDRVECRACDGTGEVWRHCTFCDGRGHLGDPTAPFPLKEEDEPESVTLAVVETGAEDVTEALLPECEVPVPIRYAYGPEGHRVMWIPRC